MTRAEQSDHELTIRTNTGEAVSVRDIPMSIIQAIYHEVTGRTETLRYNTDKPFLLDLKDLKQLYFKLQQLLEQYEVVGATYTVKVDYDDDRSSTFSGWDKFLSQIDVTKREPVISVNVKLEFMISLPRVKEYFQEGKFHRYTVDMSFVSKSAIDMFEIFGFARKMQLLHAPTIMIKIEYVDYVVAKMLLNTVKEWVSTLDILQNRWHFPKLQKISYEFSYFFVRLGMLSAAAPCYVAYRYMRTAGSDMLEQIAIWMMLAGIILVAAQMMFRLFAEMVEHHVDRTQELSCISITRGDRDVYEKRLGKNRSHVKRAVAWSLAAVATMLINIISSLIYNAVVGLP